MQIVFSDEVIPDSTTKSIFLAGPSPRSLEVFDWRVDAVAYLEKVQFDGIVYIPRWRSQFYKTIEEGEFDYDHQIVWERTARKRADVEVFWLARDIKGKMPGFVTNFELGEDYKLGHVLYGRPDSADKVGYMTLCAELEQLPVYKSLTDILDVALSQLGNGAYRNNGAELVPLVFWNHSGFKTWYASLLEAGNKLVDFEVTSASRTEDGGIFSFTFKPSIYIAAENRVKSIETVVARPDISAVVPYFRDASGEICVLLVKEFRSAVNNKVGYVVELPSGSGNPDNTPLEVARDELHEECGIYVEDISRFRFVGSRQLAATMLLHRAHVFAIELTLAEVSAAVAKGLQAPLGKASEDERTTMVSVPVYALMSMNVDFSMIGMIYQALTQ